MRRWPMLLLPIGLLVLVLITPSASQVPGSGGAQFVPLADITVTGAATVLEGQRGDRLGLICTNNDSAVNVRVGDSTVTATKGVRLKAGNSISVSSTASIQAISEGANVTVSCVSERR